MGEWGEVGFSTHLLTHSPIFTLGVLATARRGAATPAPAGACNRDFRCHPEAGTHPVGYIIDCNILGLLVKVLIDQHGKAVQLIYVIIFFWFIQNHCKGWTRSATGLEEYPDRSDLLFLEIILQNSFGFL